MSLCVLQLLVIVIVVPSLRWSMRLTPHLFLFDPKLMVLIFP